MGALLAPVAGAVIGGLFTKSASNQATKAQQSSDAARLAEEKRVREQLRADTEAQRAIADQAFADYKAGLISYGEAQQKAAQALQQVQTQIGQSQLSDVAKTQEMAKFQPWAIRTGVGNTFVDQATGQAGFNLSPEMQAYQQSLLGQAGQAAGAIAATPEQAAARYMEQQQGLLQPGRQAEDIALRQQQLQRGRIGLGIASEAAGAGAGGMVNPEQFQRDRARALADAQIAAGATEAGQRQAASQLDLTKGLFAAGMAPETYGLDVLRQGVGYGQAAQQAGINQANLFAGGMGDYYRSLLGAAQTGQEGALAIPAAERAAQQEAYQRQQTYLGQLQGSNLPYQAMNIPQATVPGSAYAMGALGSGLMNAGMAGIQKAFNTTGNYAPNYLTAFNYGTNPRSQQTSMLAAQDSAWWDPVTNPTGGQ